MRKVYPKSECTTSDKMPVLAISPEKIEKITNGFIKKRIWGKKLRLKRGITMDTDAHHIFMPKLMAGKRKIRPSPGSKRGM